MPRAVTIRTVSAETANSAEASTKREGLYQTAVAELGKALDRVAAGYEADPAKRLDLRQEIHLQLWKSLETFDGRCSLKTWALRVAHNTAVTHVQKEQRLSSRFVSIEVLEQAALNSAASTPDIDRGRALEQLTRMIHELKPVDRQIMISYLEGLDMTSIAEVTGLSSANVAMKVHRIKNLLASRFRGEEARA
jgi:RNA polymerase sigma-70 factor (ECF subfamily)